MDRIHTMFEPSMTLGVVECLYQTRAGHSWSSQMVEKETRLADTAVTVVVLLRSSQIPAVRDSMVVGGCL